MTASLNRALDRAGLERFSTTRYLVIWGVLVVIILGAIVALLVTGASNARSGTPRITPTPISGQVLTGTVVTVDTTKGVFKITLDADNPALKKTIANIRAKVASGFYDGKIFHRVLDWVAQGGDPACPSGTSPHCGLGGGTLTGEYVETPFDRGSVGMASSTSHALQVNDSQWFVVKKDSPTLTNNYPRFGKVTEGLDVVDKLVGCTFKADNTTVDNCDKADKINKATLDTK